MSRADAYAIRARIKTQNDYISDFRFPASARWPESSALAKKRRSFNRKSVWKPALQLCIVFLQDNQTAFPGADSQLRPVAEAGFAQHAENMRLHAAH